VRTRTGSRLRRLVESAAMTDHQRTYLVRTLGCQMNVHDSERMSGLLEDAGYAPATTRTEKSLVDQAEGADVVVINTCAVRENASDRLYGNLGQLAGLKKTHPGLQIAVGGCRPSRTGPGSSN